MKAGGGTRHLRKEQHNNGEDKIEMSTKEKAHTTAVNENAGNGTKTMQARKEGGAPRYRTVTCTKKKEKSNKESSV